MEIISLTSRIDIFIKHRNKPSRILYFGYIITYVCSNNAFSVPCNDIYICVKMRCRKQRICFHRIFLWCVMFRFINISLIAVSACNRIPYHLYLEFFRQWWLQNRITVCLNPFNATCRIFCFWIFYKRYCDCFFLCFIIKHIFCLILIKTKSFIWLIITQSAVWHITIFFYFYIYRHPCIIFSAMCGCIWQKFCLCCLSAKSKWNTCTRISEIPYTISEYSSSRHLHPLLFCCKSHKFPPFYLLFLSVCRNLSTFV